SLSQFATLVRLRIRSSTARAPAESAKAPSSIGIVERRLDQNRIDQSKACGHTRRASMNLKLTVAVLVITAVPVFAQAQKPNAVIVTHAEARKVLEIIKGDKAKTQTYCDMVKLGHEMAAADEKKTDELNQKMGELQKKLGAEYAALMEGFQDIDLGSEVGQAISSMFAALDGLCGG
ncbi:MAG: hypothetical protein WCA25_20605, partial [Pseudolabrys sp.]